jgi:hypothetical protein
MPEFIPGLDLCAGFFDEIARPILEKQFPALRYSAGLIGSGSDVIGMDDAMSRDHNWGPRFYLFLAEDDLRTCGDEVAQAFADGFPTTYRGYSTHFGDPDWSDNGTRRAVFIEHGPVHSLVEIVSPRGYFESYLGFDPRNEISPARWLATGEHRLLAVTSGRVFRDDLGLEAIRRKLAYFPHDLWLWLMAAQWDLLAEEEPFVGRCGWRGDDTGSRIIAARQVQRVMRLGFLLEKSYAPYSKWFGSAFEQLDVAGELRPHLRAALRADGWETRETALGRALQVCATRHNGLGVTPPLDTGLRSFFGRPFKVLFAGRFAEALLGTIQDPAVQALGKPLGSPSQFSDSTAVFDDSQVTEKLIRLYE